MDENRIRRTLLALLAFSCAAIALAVQTKPNQKTEQVDDTTQPKTAAPKAKSATPSKKVAPKLKAPQVDDLGQTKAGVSKKSASAKSVSNRPTAQTAKKAGSKTAVKGKSVKRTPDEMQGMSHAKELASAMLVWAQDHNATFPVEQSTWGATLETAKRLGSVAIMNTMNPSRQGSFHFNMSLSGVSLDSITDPRSTPMFYDGFPWPDGRFLVAFADSRVAFIRTDEWARIVKRVK